MNDCQTCSSAGVTAHRQWSQAAVSSRLFRGLTTGWKFISKGRKTPTEIGGASALTGHWRCTPRGADAKRAAACTGAEGGPHGEPNGVLTKIAWLDGRVYLSTDLPRSRTCCNPRLVYIFASSRADRLVRRAAVSASSENVKSRLHTRVRPKDAISLVSYDTELAA